MAANANADAMMQPALGMAPGMMMPGMAALGNMNLNMNMLPAMQMGQMMSGFPVAFPWTCSPRTLVVSSRFPMLPS